MYNCYCLKKSVNSYGLGVWRTDNLPKKKKETDNRGSTVSKNLQ